MNPGPTGYRTGMLTLTENASTIINSITTQPEAEPGTALRITAGSSEEGLVVSTATVAEPGDATVENEGAVVHLDAGAAELLDDKILDASVTEDGKVEFAIGQQAE